MQLAQRIHHIRVVPLTCPTTDVFHPFDRSDQRPPIETSPGDRVERTGHRENACPERDDIPLETGGIARPIPALMVVPHERSNLSQRGVLRDHVCPNIGVSSHDLPLFFRQWARLVEDFVTNSDLAEVMEGRGGAYQLHFAIT